MQLFPQQNFTIVRQLAVSPSESGTYYVKAVVRNAQTDAILNTVQLTDKGSYRFSGAFRAPADPQGQGVFVSIVTSVYTDSSYTTKSEVWGDEENTYLVADLKNARGAYGGLDIGELRRVIKEELGNLPTPQWEGVTGAIGALQREINRIPKDSVDTNPLMGKLDELLRAVREKPVTPATDLSPVLDAIAAKEVTPETDLSPVLSEIDDLRNEVALNHSESQDALEGHMAGLKDELPTMIDTHAGNAMGRAKFNLNMPFSMNMTGQNPIKQAEEPQFDVSKLM